MAALDALGLSFGMFWQILWALVLGFALSGAVEAVVSKEEMSRLLPDDGPRSLAIASALGAASSSCSYAGVAIARSIFRKGADFTAAMAFEIASTNLVIELGIVLVVLMGWQFTTAEFVGGPIMIVLLALTGGAVIGARRAAAACRHLAGGDGNEHQMMAGVSEAAQAELDREPPAQKLTSKAA